MTFHFRLVASLLVCMLAGTTTCSSGGPEEPHDVPVGEDEHVGDGGAAKSVSPRRRAAGSEVGLPDGLGQRKSTVASQEPLFSGWISVPCTVRFRPLRSAAAVTCRATSTWSEWPSNVLCV